MFLSIPVFGLASITAEGHGSQGIVLTTGDIFYSLGKLKAITYKNVEAAREELQRAR